MVVVNVEMLEFLLGIQIVVITFQHFYLNLNVNAFQNYVSNRSDNIPTFLFESGYVWKFRNVNGQIIQMV